MTETYTPENLFAGNGMSVVSGTVTLVTGQDLEKGSVLGKVTREAGAPASEGNSGDGEVTGVAMGAATQLGDYTLICTSAPTEAGANDAGFAVFAPDGKRLEDAVQGVTYGNDHLGFTIGNADEADFAVSDSFTIPITAVDDEWKLVNSANVDGSAEPRAVLAADVDASEEDKTAPVYLTGEFNEEALTFGGTDDADTHREALRELGIFLKTIA